MQKVSLKSLVTIALVLSCGFMFAVIILPNAIGEDDEPVVSWTEDAENISKSQDVNIDFENGTGSASVSISGERLDDDGNVVGSVSVSAGASLDAGNQQVSYWVVRIAVSPDATKTRCRTQVWQMRG